LSSVPISTPQIFIVFLLTAAIFFIGLFFYAVLVLKKPKAAGRRKNFESSSKEIVGLSILLAVNSKENPVKAKLLEDIEAPEFSPPSKGSLCIPLSDIEF
jgi:hypothetical protein